MKVCLHAENSFIQMVKIAFVYNRIKPIYFAHWACQLFNLNSTQIHMKMINFIRYEYL